MQYQYSFQVFSDILKKTNMFGISLMDLGFNFKIKKYTGMISFFVNQ